jgi:DICT domain-containing protein
MSNSQSGQEGSLPISAVAEATGVSAAVLRAWEQRYGFPVAARAESGHRRFDAQQVEEIRRVVRERDAGLSLERAIERARSRERDAQVPTSIFAALRRRRPDLPVHGLRPRTMLAISRAIEDECCAQADAPMLFGSFQREPLYRRSQPRWRELARTATVAVVFADFARNRTPKRGPVEVALPETSALRREWAVICDAPDAAACLAGVELPADDEPRGRRFEALWSVDPVVVRDAAEVAAQLARHYTNDAYRIEAVPPGGPTDPAVALRRATALTNRIVAYLERPETSTA